MPPRVVMNNAGTTAQKKRKANVPSKYPKSPAKPVSSTPPKAEPDAFKIADVKPSPTVETPKAEKKAEETFQDLKKPSTKVEPEKEISVDDANVEDKESIKDADKASTEGSEEGVKRIDLENKEVDAVMHEAQDNKEQQNEPGENNVVIDEQSHGNEVSEGAGSREEGVEGDGGDEQHDVEMPAMVKERIKQKDFEVFVGGLHNDADEEDLKTVFSEVGEVVEVRLAKIPLTQKNKGFGFVRFATVEQAKKAASEFKNPQVRGKQCRVIRSQSNETLLLRNIRKSWTKEVLKMKLTEYGIENIEEITLREDPRQEGTNRGFAFLEFLTHLEARNALNRLQKRDVFFGIERCAKVVFAKSSIEQDEEVKAQVKSIFVDGLPPSWDEERVHEEFKSYGKIEKVELARNMPTAQRKDFGFIYFTTREAALTCIEGVNKNKQNEENNKVTLKATLRRPKQKGRSVKDGFRAGYGGTFGTAYYRRPPGRADVRSESRRNYREDDAYLDRRARPSAKSVTRDDYGYPESMPPRKPPYSHRMKGMSAKSGSKRPYSAVDDDLPYPGRHSGSRLDYYDAGAADSRYGGVSRLGQDPQLGYGAGSRGGEFIQVSTCLVAMMLKVEHIHLFELVIQLGVTDVAVAQHHIIEKFGYRLRCNKAEQI